MLVTTLRDHARVSKDDLSALYARRWNIELDLRNLKTTTGMDVLSCQTPQMNEKQLWVHLLAYNAIRLLMAQAASKAGVDPRELSFKHTVQLWTEWVSRGLSTVNIDARLLTLIAQCRVANRPGRLEPRMRKRRPKPYPWLKVPRAHAASKNQDSRPCLGDKVSAIRVKTLFRSILRAVWVHQNGASGAEFAGAASSTASTGGSALVISATAARTAALSPAPANLLYLPSKATIWP